MLDTFEISQEPVETMAMKPALDTLIGSTTISSSSVSVNYSTNSANSTTTPTSEKRSSVFGLSSLSRFLPHLSKTNLPKSPTSPVSSPIAASKSFPRQLQQQPGLKDAPIPTAVNHLNVSTLRQDENTTSMKRSNSVAFISSRDNNVETKASSKLNNEKPRPTSFQSSQSMDLFDLTEDPATIVKSPTKLQFNFEPLVPTHTLSPTQVTPTLRNIIPANIHSDIMPNITTTLDIIQDDDFGDFAAEKGDLGEDDFGDFKQEDIQSPSFSSVKPTPTDFIDDDPFGIMGNSSSKQTNSSSENDPYGIASYSSHPSPALQSNNLIGIDSSYTQHQTHTLTPIPPAVGSPKIVTPTFDLLTPTSATNSQLKAQPFDTATANNKITADLLDFDHNAFAMNEQKSKPDTNAKVVDDDDWGDWTF